VEPSGSPAFLVRHADYDGPMQHRHPTTLIAFAILTTALTAACGDADNEPGPGGVSIGEARALDEAAKMIESRYPPAKPATAADQKRDDVERPATTQ